MPVYLHICNLIIPKEVVKAKYHGGMEQFRLDYGLPGSEINQEDDCLFCLCKMNADEFDLDSLMAKGIDYNTLFQSSADFNIVSRYSGALWETKWLQHNMVFAWHKEEYPILINRAKQISEMTLEQLEMARRNGKTLLDTINSDNSE